MILISYHINGQLRRRWFGPASFWAGCIGVFLNFDVLLTLYLTGLWAFYIFVLPVYILVLVVLLLIRGRPRQAGAGLGLSLAGVALGLLVIYTPGLIWNLM